ncbi:MAG: tyrosine-type recombinase/integrase [Lachnospiraceae bacterium]|nr:tyrosine-type recombinase/integrase [Lachnospiraceae bacterium]
MGIRSKGEGTIYKNAKGYFIAQYYDNNGKRKTISGKRESEVRKKLRQALNDLDEGTYVDTPDVTLGNFMKDYLENYKSNEIQRTTLDSYKEYMEFYLYPYDISKVRLDKVTTDKMQKFYNEMSKRGLSSRTVRYTFSILNGGFENARKRNLISSNPNRDVIKPRKVKREIEPPTVEEMKKFLEYMKNDKYYALWRIYILYGLRKSEALAISTQDINFDTGEVFLRHSLGYIQNTGLENSKRKKIHVLKNDMKNSSSVATLVFDAETLEAIKKTLEWQAEKRKENEPIYRKQILFMTSDNRFTLVDNNLIFTKEDGDFIPGRRVAELMDQAYTDLGFDHKRVHDLRHFFGSEMMKRTSDLVLTSRLMRHSLTSTTADIYLHYSNQDKQAAMNNLHSAIDVSS